MAFPATMLVFCSSITAGYGAQPVQSEEDDCIIESIRRNARDAVGGSMPVSI
jgi:hypothetical protein